MERNYIMRFEENEWIFKADNKDVSIIEDLTAMVASFNVKKAFKDSDKNFTYLYAIKNLVETGQTIDVKVEPVKDGVPDVKVILMIAGENCFSFFGKAIDKLGNEVPQIVNEKFVVHTFRNTKAVLVEMDKQQKQAFLNDPIWANASLQEPKTPQYEDTYTKGEYTGPAYKLPTGGLTDMGIADILSNSFSVSFNYSTPNHATFNCVSVKEI